MAEGSSDQASVSGELPPPAREGKPRACLLLPALGAVSLLPDGLCRRLDTGAAGAAEAGGVLVAAEAGLQDQVTVGQLRLVDTVPAGVPGLGGQCCEKPVGRGW